MHDSVWRALWAAVVVAAVFASGVLVGRRWPGGGAPSGPDLEITRSALLDALDPTPSQREELERVMGRARTSSDSVMRTLLGEIRDITREAEREMRVVLTSEQGSVLDTLIAHPLAGESDRRRRPES
ncbi:MAG: hypothetical protein PVI57_18880 [Gemmatimonadota bacterium]|jgi:hypothetical protein